MVSVGERMPAETTGLEIKVAYVENAQAEMDELIQQLFQRIERLEAELRSVQAKMIEDAGPLNLADEKPPHY